MTALDPWGSAQHQEAEAPPAPRPPAAPAREAPRAAQGRPSGPLCKREKLKSPDQAGAASREVLEAWKVEYPHMRPCPKFKSPSGGWMWVAREMCRECQSQGEPHV